METRRDAERPWSCRPGCPRTVRYASCSSPKIVSRTNSPDRRCGRCWIAERRARQRLFDRWQADAETTGGGGNAARLAQVSAVQSKPADIQTEISLAHFAELDRHN